MFNAFHQACDNRGVTLTVVRSSKGIKFGGYTREPWTSPPELKNKRDDHAFLFQLTKPKKYKLKNGMEDEAVQHHPD